MEIEISHLTMTYGETIAVRDLSLLINEGEMLVLLGPSGCGKTSTMRCVAGLEQPREGTIRIGDEIVFSSATRVSVPANKRRTGMVFQSYAIWPHKTVAQNVAFPLRMQRRPKDEIKRRVEETLELVGLSDFGSRGASLLSGGQMQRVALARSLVGNPRVLLLDEPLSNLDAKLRDRLRFELKEIQLKLGLTGIYVTHDQSEALALADRIAVMDAGRIVQLADPVDLYERPNSRFVADFLGMTNLFDTEVLSREAGRTRVKLRETGFEMLSAADADDRGAMFACIRPESAEILAGDVEPRPNVWPGVVEVASFLGTQVRSRVNLDGGPTLDIASPKATRYLPPESKVSVHVDPADVMLLRD